MKEMLLPRMKEACVSNIPFLSLKRTAYPCTEFQQLYNCLEIEARQLQSLTTVQKEVMAGEKCVFLTTLVYPGPQIFFCACGFWYSSHHC